MHDKYKDIPIHELKFCGREVDIGLVIPRLPYSEHYYLCQDHLWIDEINIEKRDECWSRTMKILDDELEKRTPEVGYYA